METKKILVSVMILMAILSTSNMYSQNRNGGGRGRMQNIPTFESYDLNKDGVITESEFTEARKARINQRAKNGGMMRNTKNAPTFKSIDTNNDGKISSEEFIAHQAQYSNRRNFRGR